MEQQKNFDNSGSLFINDRKESDKHPDYKGSIIINGQKYWLNGWLRTRDKKDGTGKVQFISLAVKETESASRPVAGFPTMAGNMLGAAAAMTARQQTPAAPKPAPAAAPATAPAGGEGSDDLPF